MLVGLFKKEIIIAVVMLFAGHSSSIAAIGNGNGGDFVRQKFIEMGQQALGLASANPEFVAKHNLDFKVLAATLTTDRIVVDENVELRDSTGSLVDAVYHYESGILELKYSSWQKFLSSNYNATKLIFHEMLRMSGYNDKDFIISNELSENKTQVVITSGDLITQLFEQIEAFKYDGVVEMLNRGAYVNSILEYESQNFMPRFKKMKTTPLALASNIPGTTGEKIVHLLLDRGASFSFGKVESILDSAVNARQESVVKRLLKMGANPNEKSFQFSYSTSYLGYLNSFSSILSLAVARGNLNIVNLLLDAGAIIAPDTLFDVIYYAVYNSARENRENNDTFLAIQQLVQKGAEINFRDAHFGNTSLILAAVIGLDQCIQLLVESKASLNLKNGSGHTALIAASIYSRTGSVIEVLVHAGAELNLQDIAGDTALMHIIKNNGLEIGKKIELLKLLLSKGADINIKTNRSYTALDIVRYDEYVENRSLLEEFFVSNGAKSGLNIWERLWK